MWHQLSRVGRDKTRSIDAPGLDSKQETGNVRGRVHDTAISQSRYKESSEGTYYLVFD